MKGQADRPMRGILLMACFCVLAPLGDGLAKLLGESVSLGTLVLTRFAMQVALLTPIMLWAMLRMGKGLRLDARLWWFTLARSALHIVGMWTMFASLQYLPLADTIAIAFVGPFILLLLGWALLGEQVGPHRLSACAVGFMGTLLVIQPNLMSVGLPALLPLLCALTFALFMLVTRVISRDIDAVQLQVVSGAQACLMLLPVLLIAPHPAFALALPEGSTLWLLLGFGTLGMLAHLLMTGALRYAPSATLAPMQYLEIPVATVIGWLFFRELPNGLALAGIMITIGAGLYIILRERAIAQDLAQNPQTP